MPFYSSSIKNVSNSISSVVNDKKSDKMISGGNNNVQYTYLKIYYTLYSFMNVF